MLRRMAIRILKTDHVVITRRIASQSGRGWLVFDVRPTSPKRFHITLVTFLPAGGIANAFCMWLITPRCRINSITGKNCRWRQFLDIPRSSVEPVSQAVDIPKGRTLGYVKACFHKMLSLPTEVDYVTSYGQNAVFLHTNVVLHTFYTTAIGVQTANIYIYIWCYGMVSSYHFFFCGYRMASEYGSKMIFTASGPSIFDN